MMGAAISDGRGELESVGDSRREERREKETGRNAFSHRLSTNPDNIFFVLVITSSKRGVVLFNEMSSVSVVFCHCPLLLCPCPVSSVNYPVNPQRFALPLRRPSLRSSRRRRQAMASMLPESPLAHDVYAAAVTAGAALGLLKFWDELAKRGVFEQKLTRKLVHITVGLVFMLFWPLFSSGAQAPLLASLAPGVNIIRMLLLGLGIWKNDATVKSMSRHGDYRELLKGPLYYACTITVATLVFWRTSPMGIAAICNLCAGDGLADIVGRRLGKNKISYNPNKTIEGSFAMAIGGFIASIAYMHYFSTFGYMETSWGLSLQFLLVSLAAAFVESLPVSSELDDNLTVPLTSLLLGGLVF